MYINVKYVHILYSAMYMAQLEMTNINFCTHDNKYNLCMVPINLSKLLSMFQTFYAYFYVSGTSFDVYLACSLFDNNIK